ncbi:hypothetical protein K439DRAFT_1391008 [Ramaria rubella]|nr:hypothetical protein K439DRAFT_1391008 [Ramaria rubella]
MSQYSFLSTPDPEWLQAAASLPPPPEQPLPIELERRNFTQGAKTTNQLWDYPKSGLRISDEFIPVQGASIRIRTYIPESNDDVEATFPVLMWFHGGGFRIGDLELDDSLLRLICKTNQISCVSVEYRLAPEHPFPIPVQDCFDATKWVAANALSVSGDLTKGFLVGGASAGGNLTAVVALKARDDHFLKGKLTGQILSIPVIISHEVYPEKWKAELLSIEQNKDAPILTKDSMVKIYADYQAPDLTSPDVAPLLAASHAELPPAYVQICGLDPLRDEGFLYEKVLRESSVPTKVDIYPGVPHGFWIAAPVISSGKKIREDTLRGIKWLLETKAR